jgi:three-Cys-motif partner protein
VEVIHGTFDESMTSTLEYLEEQKKRLAPAFVMVDPFGVKGTPMSVIRGILQNRRCEVYVSFMYEAINRWKKAPQFEEHLDALFGCQEWRDGRDIGDSSERKKFFYDLFEKQLRDAGAKHVIRFELYEENLFVYAIFFAAQELTGADRMKAAIWNADPSGDFRFRGTKQGELDLGLDDPDFEPLKQTLRDRFAAVPRSPRGPGDLARIEVFRSPPFDVQR